MESHKTVMVVTGTINQFRRLMTWLGGFELATLIGLGLVAAGLWAFIEIADEVVEGEVQSIDRSVLLSMRSSEDVSDPIGGAWLEELGRDVTALGGVTVLTFMTVAVVGYLVLQRKPRAALFVVAAVAGGFAVSHALKAVFERARPDLVPHGSHVHSASFPSGHAMMAAATYLTLGALLARVCHERRLKAYFLLLALVLTLAVGVSRVYLGVHWPTDVLAGWTLGVCWASLCWLVARRLQRSGRMEEERITEELKDEQNEM